MATSISATTSVETTTLHIASSLHQGRLPEALLRSFRQGDTLILTGAAVYAALIPAKSDGLEKSALPFSTVALQPDVVARGLLATWPNSIALVDHGGFVDLCVQHGKSLSWS